MTPRFSRIIVSFVVGSLCLPMLLLAHSDPVGDIHPTVVYDRDHFVIYFTATSQSDRVAGSNRMIFSPANGNNKPQLIATEPDRSGGYDPSLPYGTAENGDGPVVMEFGQTQKDKRRFMLLGSDGKFVTRTPLPIPAPDGRAWITDSWADEHSIAVLWSTGGDNATNPVELRLSWVNRPRNLLEKTVTLGTPATIYYFPRASNLVWAQGRMWTAWVQPADQNKPDTKADWTTILSSYDPATQTVTHKALPQPSHWNTTVSLLARDGWVCVAWHCSQKEGFPPRASIEYAFEPIAK